MICLFVNCVFQESYDQHRDVMPLPIYSAVAKSSFLSEAWQHSSTSQPSGYLLDAVSTTILSTWISLCRPNKKTRYRTGRTNLSTKSLLLYMYIPLTVGYYYQTNLQGCGCFWHQNSTQIRYAMLALLHIYHVSQSSRLASWKVQPTSLYARIASQRVLRFKSSLPLHLSIPRLIYHFVVKASL